MHIPDGFLTGEAAAAGWVVAGAGVAFCLHKAKQTQRERDLPVAGLAAAFFLVGDLPLFPVGLGTQAHLLGGLLACALLGPWLGALTITVVTFIQALALGDGGVTTLGLGIVNLALVPAFLGYPLLLALRRAFGDDRRGLAVAAAISAWVCVFLAAVLFVTEFAVGRQADIDVGTVTGVTLGAYAAIGVVEGVITALILRALLAVRPDLVHVGAGLHRRQAEQAINRLREQSA